MLMSVGVKSSHKNDLYKDYFKISFCIVKKYDILSKKNCVKHHILYLNFKIQLLMQIEYLLMVHIVYESGKEKGV